MKLGSAECFDKSMWRLGNVLIIGITQNIVVISTPSSPETVLNLVL